MTWKNEIKKRNPLKPPLDRFGRDYEERGLDDKGKPIPKKDEFLEEMKHLLSMYEKSADRPQRQLITIKEMLEECQDELKIRNQPKSPIENKDTRFSDE